MVDNGAAGWVLLENKGPELSVLALNNVAGKRLEEGGGAADL